jgi:NADH-quinone oxidoreductase subunit G
MPTIYIDNQPYEVRDGLNLLQACLELGQNLPYFCWHPAMGSVGACRQCAIKQFRDENDTRGRIVMACMTPAANNTRISLADQDARDFRASVIEWLMVNHPHDCPVCDEGGECHLQDMTLMTGHNYRRYRGDKRTFQNQNLGPFINHEMNRCIQCYRCVRYYRDYAGGKDFNAFALHDTVYFGRANDGTLESEFSGNLVEVCPTGVFTDKTFKSHYTRKWDLQTAPSICVNCAVGCNTIPGERYGTLRRISNRYNGDVNGYFLCDRGRYGYEFVNAKTRIRAPRLRGPRFAGTEGTTSKEQALKQLAELLSGPAAGGPVRMIGIGSPRASLESNYALRTLVGAENFYQGIPESERRMTAQIIDILQHGPARSPSLHEIATADAVLVLGEDVSNTAPMVALALRQAVRQQPLKRIARLRIPTWDDFSVREAMQNEKGPLFLATITNTRIDDIATGVFHGAPQDLARLGFAIAHELDASAPAVDGLTGAQRELAKTIAAALKGAEHPLVISGTGSGSESEAVIQAAANVAWALCQGEQVGQLSYVVPETNSMGLGLMGGFGPDRGRGLEAAIQAAQGGQAVVFILENDLSRRATPAQLDELFRSAAHVIVLDHLDNSTSARADVVLPAGTFAESDGTLVNHEGRAQRFYQVFVPADNPAAPPAEAGENTIVESWRWIKDILAALGRSEGAGWSNLDAIDADMAQALPVFQPVLEIAPPASYRIAGQKIAREPARWSGRTAITTNINVHEPKPPEDEDSPLAFSMEGASANPNPPLQPPPALIPRFWAPGWNSNQAVNKFQSEINGPLHGGNPGRRLIEPGSGAPVGAQVAPVDSQDAPVDAQVAPAGTQRPAYFSETPPSFEPRPGEWLVVPLYHVFGSEELSMLTPGVAERAPQPYLAIHPQDAAALLGVALPAGESGNATAPNPLPVVGEGETLILELNGTSSRLPVRLAPGFPRGLVGVPVGLPGLPFFGSAGGPPPGGPLPGWGKLAHAAEGGGD